MRLFKVLRNVVCLGLVLFSGAGVKVASAVGEHVCDRIPVGTSVTHKSFVGYFDNAAAGDYLLTRLPSQNGVDQYEIVLNYRFNPDDQSIKDFVSDCFKRMDPYLVGPSGEQVSLRLPRPTDDVMSKAHDVTVSSRCGYRGQALCWTPDYSCPIIYHETLHHLGLVDEYLEGSKCRSAGPEDSVMTNPVIAQQKVLPHFRFNFYQCRIFGGEDQAKCMHALDLIEAGQAFTSAKDLSYYSLRFANGEVLPVYVETMDHTPSQERKVFGGLIPETPMVFSKLGVEIPDNTFQSLTLASAKFAKAIRTAPAVLVKSEALPGTRKSILYPAEISTLIYAECSINANFMRCSKGAYSNHFCGGKPDVCDPETQVTDWVNLPDGLIP